MFELVNCVGGSLKWGGGGGGSLANVDVIKGGGRLMLTVADRGEGKIFQNLADVICERAVWEPLEIV